MVVVAGVGVEGVAGAQRQRRHEVQGHAGVVGVHEAPGVEVEHPRRQLGVAVAEVLEEQPGVQRLGVRRGGWRGDADPHGAQPHPCGRAQRGAGDQVHVVAQHQLAALGAQHASVVGQTAGRGDFPPGGVVPGVRRVGALAQRPGGGDGGGHVHRARAGVGVVERQPAGEQGADVRVQRRRGGGEGHRRERHPQGFAQKRRFQGKLGADLAHDRRLAVAPGHPHEQDVPHLDSVAPVGAHQPRQTHRAQREHGGVVGDHQHVPVAAQNLGFSVALGVVAEPGDVIAGAEHAAARFLGAAGVRRRGVAFAGSRRLHASAKYNRGREIEPKKETKRTVLGSGTTVFGVKNTPKTYTRYTRDRLDRLDRLRYKNIVYTVLCYAASRNTSAHG